jgi:starvation-inducible outer membrane lipoprotein
MKRKIICLVLGLALMLSACSINPSEFSDGTAKDLVAALKYAKDKRTGLCFAMVASRKTGNTDQTGLGFTNVPCTPEVERILVK